MKVKPDKNYFFPRFAPCVRGVRLLMILPQAAGCALAGGTFIFSPVGFGFSDDFRPALTDASNLTRGGIFRGKVLPRKNQNHINRLEERTPPAPNS
jgi:hypothetical protein